MIGISKERPTMFFSTIGVNDEFLKKQHTDLKKLHFIILLILLRLHYNERSEKING